MRALSIIGIVMSLGGILAAIVVMTETRCYCYDSTDYWNSGTSTPEEAIGGGVVMLLISVFFLIFSIISCVVSFGKKEQPVTVTNTNYSQPFTTYPPYQQPQYGNPGQNPYTQQYQNPLQQQPYQQPPQYQQPPVNNPYQNPAQNNPYQNPNAPKNPYVNPNANPYQTPPQNNPYQNPNQPKNPYQNPNPPAPPTTPEPPKNPYSPPTPPTPPKE